MPAGPNEQRPWVRVEEPTSTTAERRSKMVSEGRHAHWRWFSVMFSFKSQASACFFLPRTTARGGRPSDFVPRTKVVHQGTTRLPSEGKAFGLSWSIRRQPDGPYEQRPWVRVEGQRQPRRNAVARWSQKAGTPTGGGSRCLYLLFSSRPNGRRRLYHCSATGRLLSRPCRATCRKANKWRQGPMRMPALLVVPAGH